MSSSRRKCSRVTGQGLLEQPLRRREVLCPMNAFEAFINFAMILVAGGSTGLSLPIHGPGPNKPGAPPSRRVCSACLPPPVASNLTSCADPAFGRVLSIWSNTTPKTACSVTRASVIVGMLGNRLHKHAKCSTFVIIIEVSTRPATVGHKYRNRRTLGLRVSR